MNEANDRWHEPHTVYLLMLGDEIVYVGCTYNLKQRLLFHKDKVYTSVKTFRFKNKQRALQRERDVLVEHMPKYNWVPLHILKRHKAD